MEFYSSGAAPTKNEVAMKNAMDAALADLDVDADHSDAEMEDAEAAKPKEEKKEKKEKKERKKEKKDKKEKKEKKNKD